MDDEGTPGSVDMRVDATDLAGPDDAITAIWLNTAFDSDTMFVQVNPTTGGNTYDSRANNEDGFPAGNTDPNFNDGPLFDLRLLFNTPTGGGDLLGVDNPIFEATLTLMGGDLTMSDFFPELSTENPNPMGDQGPFQISLRAVQTPGGGDGHFAGVVPEPSTALLLGGGLAALASYRRKR
ncbi:MAG: PEP-CTERM sorting domain-containing protein [Myxococcota bacterium]|nr:PEP-CTERM sorting domain-containing protein [Myxococcota bacterium]